MNTAFAKSETLLGVALAPLDVGNTGGVGGLVTAHAVTIVDQLVVDGDLRPSSSGAATCLSSDFWLMLAI